MSLQLRIVVRGRVQGVGFRYSTVNRATELGVLGWVRNRGDGSVEIVAQGDRPAVDALLDWCHRGPTSARVDRVTANAEPATEVYDSFEVR